MTKKKSLRFGLRHKGRRIFIDVKRDNGAIGLMFKKRENASALLFEFDPRSRIPLHSWFVFFPFLVIWLDGNNKMLEMRVINPFSFRILPRKSFSNAVEIPLNKKYSRIIQKLVGKRKV